MNNPLSYTDPSGYFSFKKFFKKWIRPLAAIAVAVFMPQVVGAIAANGAYATAYAAAGGGLAGGMAGGVAAMSAYAAASTSLATAFATGAVAGAIASGNLRGAFQGALSAGLFYGAGSIGQATSSATLRVIAHAGAGCLSSLAAGGSCGSGAAGSLASVLTEGVGYAGNRFIDATARGVFGGLGSLAGGGDFGSGFANGVASYAFNCLSHSGPCKPSDSAEIRKAMAACNPLDSGCIDPLAGMAREAGISGVPGASMRASLGNLAEIAGAGASAGAGRFAIGSAWRNLSFDGPSAGLANGNGRIFGIRWRQSQWGIRLDYHPLDGSGVSVLHINYGALNRGEATHIVLYDPRE